MSKRKLNDELDLLEEFDKEIEELESTIPSEPAPQPSTAPSASTTKISTPNVKSTSSPKSVEKPAKKQRTGKETSIASAAATSTISAAPKYNPKQEEELQVDALTALAYNPDINPDFHIAKQQQLVMAEAAKYSSEQTYAYVYNNPTGTIGQTKMDKETKKKVSRSAAGESWVDPTLADWPDNDYRIFVGDLGNDVTDDTLTKAFNQFKSFNRARVVRDKRTQKSKGFGFVSFMEATDFVQALTTMNGKYIGSRPCKLRKSSWKDRSADNTTKKKHYQ